MIKKVLTIAGSDCSGGAGIQADMKTIAAHRMYGMSAITALTAQNTTGVYGIMEVTPEFVSRQLDCIFSDIVPDAIKIGMVSNAEIIDVIVEKLVQYRGKNIVVDPVMISTSGSKLLGEDAMEHLVTRLLPIGVIITPNIPEAEALCGFSLHTQEDMEKAARAIGKSIEGAVLIKGGHLVDDAVDVLYQPNGETHHYNASRIANPNTHGTGCTLSSAIACQLAAGNTMEDSVGLAKEYLTGALRAGLDIGRGSGPLDHMYGGGVTSHEKEEKI